MLSRKDIQDTHLTNILKERGPLTAESLWSASQLDIDDFYDQLKDEEARGLLRENREGSSTAPTDAGGRCMRLDRLSIPSYRNLRAFEIDFDESRPTTVLLGRNGTGKSNLIEAIVEIFRELELAGAPGFAYQLEYVCREQIIRIDADPERKSKRLAITVDGKPLTQQAFKNAIDRYLPNYVFAYYSGWSSRLERHFDRPTRRHYDRVLKNPAGELPLRRLFFCRKDYSQLVLLAFFLAPSPTARGLLQEYLGIGRFESALFVLKTPWWRGSGAPSKTQKEEGDPRFWYARGAFKGFLDRLWTRRWRRYGTPRPSSAMSAARAKAPNSSTCCQERG